MAFAKRYTDKTPITAADFLNDQVVPFFDAHDIPLLRVLTDRGTEYCGNPEQHPYERYLAVEDIEHTRTKTRHPQTKSLSEILCVRHNMSKRSLYAKQDEQPETAVVLPNIPSEWIEQVVSGPMQTFFDSLPTAKEKVLNPVRTLERPLTFLRCQMKFLLIHRQKRLLTLIERAMGKAACTGSVAEEDGDVEADEDSGRLD